MIANAPAPGAAPVPALIDNLRGTDPRKRESAAEEIFRQGCASARTTIAAWLNDAPLRDCLRIAETGLPEMVVGVAVDPECFDAIRVAMGMPRLAEVPPDQDAKEFELDFSRGVRLDVLTTREPGGSGAIARYLQKFGQGIQQIEILSHDVERATQILRTRFGIQPIYPATRPGAGGTRVNFFLVPAEAQTKVLIEIVEEAPHF